MARELGLKVKGVNNETLHFLCLGKAWVCFWLYEVGFLHYVEIFLDVEVWKEVFIMM